MDAIARFNADPKVSAYLVQLPLPSGLDEEQALLAVDPAKDADGLHPVNLGRLVLGTPGPLPCTPAGIVELLHAYDVPVEGRHAVIIGRGRDDRPPAGQPVDPQAPRAERRGDRRPHRRGAARTWSGLCGRRDIVVAAAGQPHVLTADMVKPGAAVVSAGTSFEGKKLDPRRRTPTWPRWRAGSRPASVGWAP